MQDSLAANELAEPLFNRFAHVYIETTVDSWLDWAAEPASETEEIVYEENIHYHEPSQQYVCRYCLEELEEEKEYNVYG